jgi:hypothetical protein
LKDLHDKKQLDYGRLADPFSNVRASGDFGIKPWIGALLRGNDKMRRLQKFSVEGTLANEAAEDSFRDLAVYAVIALVLFEEARTPVPPYVPSPLEDPDFQRKFVRNVKRLVRKATICQPPSTRIKR